MSEDESETWHVVSQPPAWFWRLIGPERTLWLLGMEEGVGVQNDGDDLASVFFDRLTLEKVANHLVRVGAEWVGEDLLEEASEMVFPPVQESLEGAHRAEQIVVTRGSWDFTNLDEQSARRLAKVLGKGRPPGAVALYGRWSICSIASSGCTIWKLYRALRAVAPVEAAAAIERLELWSVEKSMQPPHFDGCECDSFDW